MNNSKYDVVIVGSGIAGTMLGTILSRQGVSVLLIEAGTHPRFAIGESTVPETSMNIKLLSKRFDVPELMHLSNFYYTRNNVSSNTGKKSAFSFYHHCEGVEADPKNSTQTPTLGSPLGPDMHLFRQDTDQYLLSLAISYGCDYWSKTDVLNMANEKEKAIVETTKGNVECSFVVDGSGAFSPLASKFGIRDKSPSLMTHSRGLFTHMVGVKKWEQVLENSYDHLPYSPSQSTLHHIFDGGWMWVIPFDNQSNSTNLMCSVGVMLDSRKHPKPNCSPQEEFNQVLENFPSVKKQLCDARTVRDWVSSDRIQYSSTAIVKDRYIALPHAAAFVDPLFSNGLVLTTHYVYEISRTLLDSFESNEVEYSSLKKVEESCLKKVDTFDKLVANSFVSFRSFNLWNAWYRVWEMGTMIHVLGKIRCLMEYERTQNKDFLDEAFGQRFGQGLGCGMPEYKEMFDKCCSILEKVDRDEIPEEKAIDALYECYSNFKEIPPSYRRHNPSKKSIGKFTMLQLPFVHLWGQLFASKSSKIYYDFWATFFVIYTLKYFYQSIKKEAGRVFQAFNDLLSTKSIDSTENSKILKRPSAKESFLKLPEEDVKNTPLNQSQFEKNEDSVRLVS